MRVILTSKQAIKAKTGQEYVKCSFIDAQTGEAGDLFCTKEQFASYELPEDRVLTAEQLKALDWPVSESNAEFNQRGRLVGLK